MGFLPRAPSGWWRADRLLWEPSETQPVRPAFSSVSVMNHYETVMDAGTRSDGSVTKQVLNGRDQGATTRTAWEINHLAHKPKSLLVTCRPTRLCSSPWWICVHILSCSWPPLPLSSNCTWRWGKSYSWDLISCTTLSKNEGLLPIWGWFPRFVSEHTHTFCIYELLETLMIHTRLIFTFGALETNSETVAELWTLAHEKIAICVCQEQIK